MSDIKKFGFEESKSSTAMAEAQQSKSTQEIQAALVIAKRFPRNQLESLNRILNACKRPFLAEQALYAYPRGGQVVTGASIRMAEVAAQNWGNMTFGVREISQKNGVSEVEAFAWDLETNTQSTKIFHVSHVRNTRRGSYILTDQRDIYELVANQGARRLRACILAVVPGDVIEAAVEQVNKTLSSGEEPIQDRIKRLSMAFDEMGVTVKMLEKRLGHKLEVTIESELINLRAIYKSIKDGMASRKDFFDFGEPEVEAAAKDNVANLIAKSKKSEQNAQNGSNDKDISKGS
jgi:hypothetical protein